MRVKKEGTPAHRIPLGLLMLSRGYLSEQQLQEILAAQLRAREGRVGEWAQRLNFATERQVLTALSLQWACPVLAMQGFPDRDCMAMLPWQILEALHMAPVRFVRSTRLLYIALSRGMDHTALSSIERMLDSKVVACLVSDRTMDDWLKNQRPSRSEPAHIFSRIAEEAEMARITGNYVTRVNADDVRISRCGQQAWVRLTSKHRPTDLLFGLDSMHQAYLNLEFDPVLSAAV